MTRSIVRGLLLVALVAALAGCSRTPSVAGKPEISHLRPLTVLYASAASALHHPPQNEAEFKKYIASQKGKLLDVLKVENPDAIFISERDEQPYVVNYVTSPGGKIPDVVAYEKVGVNGKQMVGFATGVVVDMDEAQFREAVPQ
jgi:hypothetical protein